MNWKKYLKPNGKKIILTILFSFFWLLYSIFYLTVINPSPIFHFETYLVNLHFIEILLLLALSYLIVCALLSFIWFRRLFFGVIVLILISCIILYFANLLPRLGIPHCRPGTMLGIANFGSEMYCYRPYTDYGDPCQTGTDCQGLCLIYGEDLQVGGKCSSKSNIIGCFTFINDSGSIVSMCAD